jgi:hypothetical protein
VATAALPGRSPIGDSAAMNIRGLGEVEKDDDLGWYFGPPMKIAVLGGEERCIVVDGYDGDRRPEDFHAAIKNFVSLGAAALRQAAPFVFAYYKDCVAAAGAPPTIASPADVWGQVRFGVEPQVKRRPHGDKAVYVSVECACDWEGEHGLQLVFKDGLVVNKVGAFDGHLTNSDAYAEPRFEDVVYVDRQTVLQRIADRRKKPGKKTKAKR